MKFMNKKVLAAAVVGVLASGNALAAAEIQSANTVYAKEIALPTTLTVPVTYKLGYNFNVNETRYACVKLTGATLPASVATPVIRDDTGVIVAPGAAAQLSAGVVNVVGGNVAFFTLSSVPSGTQVATNEFTVSLPALAINAADYNATITASVGLYDNPAAAGTCDANSQLIPDTWDSKPLISFESAYTFTIDSHLATASVEADPSYSLFKAGSGFTAFAGGVGPVTLASNAELALRTATNGSAILDKDGTAITLADIFPATATFGVEGDFDNTEWLTSADFDGTALAIVDKTSASRAIDPVAVLDGSNAFSVTANGNGEIPTGIYKASLLATPNTGYTLNYVVGPGSGAATTIFPTIDEAAATGDTTVTDPAATAGQINQDGVKLLTPLVQLAGGDWLARLAISNTGTKDRTFVLKAQGFDSEGQSSTVTVPNVTYTVKAGSTYVFDNLANVLDFTGRARGTVTAIVNAPELEVKGVYQLVNTSANTISNINMINVSNNGTGNGH